LASLFGMGGTNGSEPVAMIHLSYWISLPDDEMTVFVDVEMEDASSDV